MSGIKLLKQGDNAGPISPAQCGAVGWLFSGDYDVLGTCFLIGNSRIATANHIIPSASDAGNFVAVFNYLVDVLPPERNAFALLSDGYVNNAELDFALVRVRPHPDNSTPGSKFQKIDLVNPMPPLKTEVVVIQHPDSLRYKGCSQGAVTGLPDKRFFLHSAESERGTSGAPVLDNGGKCVGIHTDVAPFGKGWQATSTESMLIAMKAIRLPNDLLQVFV